MMQEIHNATNEVSTQFSHTIKGQIFAFMATILLGIVNYFVDHMTDMDKFLGLLIKVALLCSAIFAAANGYLLFREKMKAKNNQNK